jgi:hypothetical protein
MDSVADLPFAQLGFNENRFSSKLPAIIFQQITDDFGAPAALGGVRSRVTGIGPWSASCFLWVNFKAT